MRTPPPPPGLDPYAPAPASPVFRVFADSHGNFASLRARSSTVRPKLYSWLPTVNAS